MSFFSPDVVKPISASAEPCFRTKNAGTDKVATGK